MSQLMGEVLQHKQQIIKSTPDILRHFSPLYHKTNIKLLKEHNITWNKPLEVKDTRSSIIADLITEAVVRKKRRIEPFTQSIAATNIPISSWLAILWKTISVVVYSAMLADTFILEILHHRFRFDCRKQCI